MATKVWRADTFLTRLVGLLKRRKLGAEEALWLVPSKGIHTIGMKFPIDVIFLTKDNKVVQAISAVAPYRATGIHMGARSVLELPKGTIKKSHTEVGDKLDVSLVESSQVGDLKESQFSQIG